MTCSAIVLGNINHASFQSIICRHFPIILSVLITLPASSVTLATQQPTTPTTLGAIRQQCLQIDKWIPESSPPDYARGAFAVDSIASALFREGFALRADVLAAAKLKPTQQNAPLERFIDFVWGTRPATSIAVLESTQQQLTARFLEYDDAVSACVTQISTGWQADLFPRLEFAFKAQQISTERDTVRTLLDSLRASIVSLENERNNRIGRTLATASGVLAAISLFLVAFQISLAHRQNRLVTEQLRLTKRQDELNRQLHAQKPNLCLRINGVEELVIVPQAPYDLNFSVFNSGDKGAPGFYNTVYIPVALQPVPADSYLGNLIRTSEGEIDGINYSIFQNFQENPVLPKRWSRIGNLRLAAAAGEYIFLWQIATEDGVFPQNGQLGGLVVRFGATSTE